MAVGMGGEGYEGVYCKRDEAMAVRLLSMEHGVDSKFLGITVGCGICFIEWASVNTSNCQHMAASHDNSSALDIEEF